MSDFKPRQSIIILKQKFIFCENPLATGIDAPHFMIAGKATVYKIRNAKNKKLFALKVFKPEYRDPNLVIGTQNLKRLHVDGLMSLLTDCQSIPSMMDLLHT